MYGIVLFYVCKSVYVCSINFESQALKPFLYVKRLLRHNHTANETKRMYVNNQVHTSYVYMQKNTYTTMYMAEFTLLVGERKLLVVVW